MEEWKKANIVPAYKKEDKQLIIIDRYRYCQFVLKLLRKLFSTFFFFFEYSDTSKLLNNKQSGLHLCDSRVYHLLSVTHEIYITFDANPSL